MHFISIGFGKLWCVIYSKHRTIIASQIPPVKNWYDVIGEQTVANAILDTLVHQSVRVALNGESIRKLKNENNKEQTDKIN